MIQAFVAGALLGGFVAAQVGPVSLLCIRTSTRSGFLPGLSVGLGAAFTDFGYALLGVLGAAALVQVAPVQIGLALLGAGVLTVMGVRTLHTAWRLRLGGEISAEVAAPAAAWRTGVIATASNPLTIISWTAIFGAASTASLVSSPVGAAALLVGVGLGSAAWFVALATVAARVGSRLGAKALAAVDFVSGVGLLGFAGLLGVRAIKDA